MVVRKGGGSDGYGQAVDERSDALVSREGILEADALRGSRVGQMGGRRGGQEGRIT